MKISEARRRTSVGFNMTPMIDIVFLLIIFFLVASHFGRQESSVEVDLPKASGKAEEDELETHRLTVSIPAAGELFLGSAGVTQEELAKIFTEEKNRRKDPFQLRIRAGKTVPFRDVEPILKAAAKLGIRDVQFAVVNG